MSAEKIAEVYGANFEVVTTGQGEEVYEWSQNSLLEFSTKKLADLITLSEVFDDLFKEDFIDSIEDELMKRIDFMSNEENLIH